MKSLVLHLGQAIGNVWQIRWFSWILYSQTSTVQLGIGLNAALWWPKNGWTLWFLRLQPLSENTDGLIYFEPGLLLYTFWMIPQKWFYFGPWQLHLSPLMAKKWPRRLKLVIFRFPTIIWKTYDSVGEMICVTNRSFFFTCPDSPVFREYWALSCHLRIH